MQCYVTCATLITIYMYTHSDNIPVQRERQTDRQRERQTDRQTDRDKRDRQRSIQEETATK